MGPRLIRPRIYRSLGNFYLPADGGRFWNDGRRPTEKVLKLEILISMLAGEGLGQGMRDYILPGA